MIMTSDVLTYVYNSNKVSIGIFNLTNKKLSRRATNSDIPTNEYDIRIIVTDWNIHILNSYKFDKKKDIKEVLSHIRSHYKSAVLNNRTDDSMTNEWISHNNLYKLHMFRSHTKDVDLDYPQKWYMSLIYWLLSRIVL